MKISAEAFNYSPYMGMKVTMSDDKVETELLICAYIEEKDKNGTSVSYIQGADSLVSDNLFDYVSYSSICK